MLQEYYDKIVEWSKERKTIPNAKLLVQVGKMMSEKSEISEAYIKQDYNEMIDGIGDTFVTIVNVTELSKLKGSNKKLNLETKYANYDSAIECILNLDVILGEVNDLLIKEKYDNAITELNKTIPILHTVSKMYNKSLEECVEVAYNEIKDRKGITLENGNFIKESDPKYKEIIKDTEETQNIETDKDDTKEETKKTQNTIQIKKKI